MSGKRLLIAVLVASLCYFVDVAFSSYLNHEAEIAKESATKELLLGIAKHHKVFAKTIAKAIKSSDLAAQVQNQSFDGFEALVRRSEESDGRKKPIKIGRHRAKSTNKTISKTSNSR
jgi:hypothetical protein